MLLQIDSPALEGKLEGEAERVKDGDTVRVEGELLILAVGNGQQAGGGVKLCPGAGMIYGNNATTIPFGLAANSCCHFCIGTRLHASPDTH